MDENKSILSKTSKEAIIHDESPFPTDKNGNSHDSQKDSFASTAAKLVSQPVLNKVKTTSFHTVRDLLQRQNPSSDDGTVIPTNKSSNLRVTIMCHIPAKDIDEDEAPLEAIRK